MANVAHVGEQISAENLCMSHSLQQRLGSEHTMTMPKLAPIVDFPEITYNADYDYGSVVEMQFGDLLSLGELPATPDLDESVQFSSKVGGLIVLGPTSSPIIGLQALLESPGAVPIKVDAMRLQGWDTARAELSTFSHLVGAAIKAGKTAIVYMNSHETSGVSIPTDRQSFVSQRLGQFIAALEEKPAYLALWNSSVAPTTLLQGLGSFGKATVGTTPSGLDLMRADSGEFDQLHVSMCNGCGPISKMVSYFDWAEARRTL